MALVKTQNYEDGSDARYDVSKMTPEERAHFDSEGLPLGRDFAPDQWVWTPGIPGARGGTGPGEGGGSPVGGGGVNPFFSQLESSLKSQSAADTANTRAALQQALISFGLVPQGFQDKLNVLDNLTKDLIAKNTDSGISTYARLLEQKQDMLKNTVRRLTQQGLRRSGTRGYKMRRGQLDWDRLFQDSLSQLMGHTSGLYNNLANNEFARQQQLMQAMANMNWGSSASVSQRSGATPPPPGSPIINQGTWAEGIDTGGYVPGSKKITQYDNVPNRGTVGQRGSVAY